MSDKSITIKRALISVYHKEGLIPIIEVLKKHNVEVYSTGGTYSYLLEQEVNVLKVEELTSYPSILGGRVKTLHPKIFGGILSRRDSEEDILDIKSFDIPPFDLVIVGLYPFEETVAQTANEKEIIEKIDIGGVSLLRAAAKNYDDVVVISSAQQYDQFAQLLKRQECSTTLSQRCNYATEAFSQTSHYDGAIFNYFNTQSGNNNSLRLSFNQLFPLRYGENPHQEGFFYGDLDKMFEQLHGKPMSYNNLLDMNAAIDLIADFIEPTVAILKHNNACGIASRDELCEAWSDALAADPVSAFGGVIITNMRIDKATALEMNKIFFEILMAPSFDDDALEILKSKKNRILLLTLASDLPKRTFRSVLNGVLVQNKDTHTETEEDFTIVTKHEPTDSQIVDLVFANKVVKHSKSNAIVLVKDCQLLASGVGQTSRIDALKQAIDKAQYFEFDLQDAVMASDAFFPFADSVEEAYKAGITAVVQPGGSMRDKDSIEFCDNHSVAMVFTGIRHFKH